MRSTLFRKTLVIAMAILIFAANGIALMSGRMSEGIAAATIYVDDDNTSGPWDGTMAHPYQNITSGLAHASDGDTVHVFNGTYRENVVLNKRVTLLGDSKPVINGWGGIGIDVTVNSVTVEGFKIMNSSYGVRCMGVSGFTIMGNTFWYDTRGLYWYIYESALEADYTVYGVTVENNEFYMNTNYEAMYAYIALNYYTPAYVSYDVSIGDISVCNNTFHMEGTTAYGIRVPDIYVDYLYGGEVSVGIVNMSENKMYGGRDGIFFYGYLDDLNYVQATVGDVIVNNNVMVNQSSYGMYIDYYDADYWEGDTTGTFGDLVIKGNTITSVYSADAIYISDYAYWEEFSDNAHLTVGNLYVEENEIDVGGYGIYVYYSYGAYDFYDAASVAMQEAYIRNNIIHGSSYGIYVDVEDFYYLYHSSSCVMRDVVVTGNTINSTDYGIYFYMYDVGYEMYGSPSVVLGDFLFNDNTITSDGYGIYVDCEEIGYDMYDASMFVMGNIEFSGNTINSSGEGIYIDYLEYFGYNMYGTPSFTMGHILVNDNVVNSGDYGIAPWSIRYFGNELYDNSSFTMGNIEFCGNVVNSTKDAIGFSQFTDFGNNMHGNSSFSMGNILVNDNTLHSIIWLSGFGRFGAYLYENSSCTMGNVEFCRNMIYSDWADVITFYSLQPFGYEMYDYSLFKMGDFSVNNNVIASDGSHSGITCAQGSGGFGINVYDNAVAITGSFEFDGNEISSCWVGLNLYSVKDAIARNNLMQNCSYGIYLQNSANNLIYHNNFINNTIQAYVTPNYNNTWDNGYPSGGNYWSDYNGTDSFSGPYQNVAGSDGIGDTPYEINENNTDRYPLVTFLDSYPPTIGIPTRTPSGDVQPLQTVKITVNVTDANSGVKNVTLYYTTNNGASWQELAMSYNSGTGLYEATIPGQSAETLVKYKIVAYDNAGNNATRDGEAIYCIYTVIPEFPTATSMLLILIMLAAAIAIHKRRPLKTPIR